MLFGLCSLYLNKRRGKLNRTISPVFGMESPPSDSFCISDFQVHSEAPENDQRWKPVKCWRRWYHPHKYIDSIVGMDFPSYSSMICLIINLFPPSGQATQDIKAFSDVFLDNDMVNPFQFISVHLIHCQHEALDASSKGWCRSKAKSYALITPRSTISKEQRCIPYFIENPVSQCGSELTRRLRARWHRRYLMRSSSA